MWSHVCHFVYRRTVRAINTLLFDVLLCHRIPQQFYRHVCICATILHISLSKQCCFFYGGSLIISSIKSQEANNSNLINTSVICYLLVPWFWQKAQQPPLINQKRLKSFEWLQLHRPFPSKKKKITNKKNWHWQLISFSLHSPTPMHKELNLSHSCTNIYNYTHKCPCRSKK